MSTTNNSKTPKFGYRLSHPESSHALGGSRFEVLITDIPTEHHFDPEKIHLHVKSKASAIESLTIRHPWFFDHAYQALAGSIELTDRYGKEEEVFSFGGRLVVETQDRFTVCTLESPAPIMEISSADPLLMMFIEEIKILLAKRSAALLSKPHSYEKHLVNADPFKLYLACLNTLIEKYESLHHMEEPLINEFLNFLHGEGKRVKDEEKIHLFVPTLEEIL